VTSAPAKTTEPGSPSRTTPANGAATGVPGPQNTSTPSATVAGICRLWSRVRVSRASPYR
jgi:hypothetical protein